MPGQLSDTVYKWCTETGSVSDVLARDPTIAPEQAAKTLFHRDISAGGEQAKRKLSNHDTNSAESSSPALLPSPTVGTSRQPTDEELERALKCGKFGDVRPSNLFLRMWHDALLTLEHHPLTGVVSPSLMGSTGVIPMATIGVVWDVCRHMSNLIVRAEKDVFFATNYWEASGAADIITDAFRELSRRAGERKQKVVVKILYDRGSLKSMIKNHQPVPSSNYSSKKLGIPSPEDIPNIDLQVMNYHRPALGTFHSKFVVADRKYALVCSNNIQGNDNLEMMTHLEGPIVDSLYDVCLISWASALDPPLPTYNTPAAGTGFPTFEDSEYKKLFDLDGNLKDSSILSGSDGAFHETSNATKGSTTEQTSIPQADGTSSGHAGDSSQGQMRLESHDPGNPNYDTSIAGEILRMRANLQPTATDSHMSLVSNHLNISTKSQHKPTATEPSSPSDFFMPYVPLPPHAPFPIALVNRHPTGKPNNASVHVPQNAAWISALQNAQKKVFIQTPDLNAKPLLPEILNAVRRGVEVEYWVCLGYNDAGELLPGQGGTNEMIAAKLYGELKKDGEEVSKRLKVGWYVGKDQERVIHKKEVGRCCHIKLMVVDDQVGIQGNGNQDAQSWFHSQEVNIMVDSELVCKSWMAAIRRNQNTHLHGIGSVEDGLWRDASGNQAKEAIGKDPGRFSWAKGIVGAVQRVRGVGGF